MAKSYLTTPQLFYVESDRALVLSSEIINTNGEAQESQDDSLYSILQEFYSREALGTAHIEELERVAIWMLKECAKVNARKEVKDGTD